MFNFDILIIIIIVLSILLGYSRGFYKQFKATLALIAPIVVINYVSQPGLNFLKGIGIFNTITNVIFKGFGYFSVITIEEIEFLIFALIVFIVVSLTVKAFLNLFSPSRKSVIVKVKTKFSKFTAAFLGIISGYCLILVALFLIDPISNINIAKPITELVVNTYGLILDIGLPI